MIGSYGTTIERGGSYGGSIVAVVTRLVPELNGSNQWIDTPEMLFTGDFVMGVDIQLMEFGAYRGIAGGLSEGNIRQHATDGVLQLNNVAGRYDTITIPTVSENRVVSLVVRRIGLVLETLVDNVVVASGACNLDVVSFNTFGRNSGSRSKVRIYNIYADDKTIHNYPCNDGFLVNPLIVNLGSIGSALANNFSESTWVEIGV